MRACKWLLITLLLLLMVFPAAAESADNLLVNGDFESLNGQGLPSGWYTDAYVKQDGYTLWSVSEDARGGDHSAVITNFGDNDARFAQRVEVEPNAYYCLSGYVKVLEMCDYGRGANLSIDGLYIFSESLYDVSGEWEYLELYGQTGPNQTDVTVFVRVGGYSGESIGSAQFDDVSLRKVDMVPGNVTAERWFRQETAQAAAANEEDGEKEASPFWPNLLVISAVYIALGLWMMAAVYQREPRGRLLESKRAPLFLIMGLIFTAAVRVAVGATVMGYQVDVNCFRSWGSTMQSVGPAMFYQTTSFCDYTPAYIYVMGFNAAVLKPLVSLIAPSLDAAMAETLAHKLVPIACDIAMAYLLYRFARREGKLDRRQAGALGLLFALNPAMALNSAGWCQIDSVLCLLLMLVAWLAIERKWAAVLPVYVFAALVKPQALMLGPLGLTAIILCLVKECREDKAAYAKSLKSMLIGLGVSAAVAAIVVLPYCFNQKSGTWLIDLYVKTLGSYPRATVNAANLYYLLDANWVDIGVGCAWQAVVIFFALACLWGAYTAWRQRGMRLRWLEPAAMGLFACAFAVMFVIKLVNRGETTVTWTYLGTAAMVMSFVIVLSYYIRGGKLENLPLCGAVLFILLYVLGIKMHERYLFPALILLGMAYAIRRDIRVFWLLIAASCTMLINEGIVLDNSIRLGSTMGHLNNDTQALNDLTSLANVAMALFSMTVCHGVCVRGEARGVRLPHYERLEAQAPSGAAMKLRRLDWVLMLSVTLVYAVVTLTTLGSAKAPQNPWKSSAVDEAVVIDLGQHYDDVSMLYFCQISYSDFTVAASEDGENWSEEYWAQMAQGQCFRWKYLAPYLGTTDSKGNRQFGSVSSIAGTQKLSGRYVRVTAQQIGLILNEVIFRDLEGNTIPATVLRAENANEASPNYSDPAALLDEQDSLEGEPGWWNSTYFDEIYHARTAYEHLHGMAPYETSHPPLGKVIMSWGVALFGMTPFGWRFAGAVAGILMLPAMYILGKQLSGRTSIGFAAMAMMTLDCMHFTQTRIATIDSFPVLFIILSWLFMLRFAQRDILGESIRRLLPDLALCGLFMGCGIASKWIGVYSGAGLAIVYFWVCLRHQSLKDGKALQALLILAMVCLLLALDGYLVVTGHISKVLCAVLAAALAASYFLLYRFVKSVRGDTAFRRMLHLCLWCLMFFVAVPAVIYLLSYIPYFAYAYKETFMDYIRLVIDAQEGMFKYHSKPGLGMDHPFYSPWYEWPLIKRPMYYASPSFVPAGWSYAIFCFGNPAVWLTGLAGIAATAFVWGKRHFYTLGKKPLGVHLVSSSRDMTPAFVLIGLLAQFLPWMLVPRGTYIYHYFASIPFLILGVCLLLHWVQTRYPLAGRVLLIAYLAVCLGFFIAYFPYASGLLTPTWWLDFMKKFLRIYY